MRTINLLVFLSIYVVGTTAHVGRKLLLGDNKLETAQEGGSPKACFPGDARVTVRGRGVAPLSELRIGHEVLSIDGGIPSFQEVYFYGHRDVSATSTFVALTIAEGNHSRQLALSDKHFLPVDGVMTYAKDARIGGSVGLADDNSVSMGTILAKQSIVGTGLYNPYTKGGSIVVNGVVASAHSDWVLDSIVPQPLLHFLPAVYQLMFKPVWWVYKVAGPELTDRINTVLVLETTKLGSAAPWLAVGGSVMALFAFQQGRTRVV